MELREIDYLQQRQKLEALSAQYMAAVRVKDYSKAGACFGTMRFICTSARLHSAPLSRRSNSRPRSPRPPSESSWRIVRGAGTRWSLSVSSLSDGGTRTHSQAYGRRRVQGGLGGVARQCRRGGIEGLARPAARRWITSREPAAVAFVISDLSDMTSWAAEKSAQATSARRPAAYADYIDRDGVPQLGYAGMACRISGSPHLNEQSEFFHHLATADVRACIHGRLTSASANTRWGALIAMVGVGRRHHRQRRADAADDVTSRNNPFGASVRSAHTWSAAALLRCGIGDSFAERMMAGGSKPIEVMLVDVATYLPILRQQAAAHVPAESLSHGWLARS